MYAKLSQPTTEFSTKELELAGNDILFAEPVREILISSVNK